jgi:hypothetical protein
MRHLVTGLALTAGVAVLALRVWGPDGGVAAATAGLVVTGAESLAFRLLRPALEPPFERMFKRWAMGLGLRFAGLVLVVLAALRWPVRFPLVPTAVGFLVVLLPLMVGEMRLVWTRLRTTR